MRRIVVICLIFFSATVLFGGCNGTETVSNGAEMAPNEASIEPEVASLPGDLGEILSSIFYLNGVIYTFPLTLPELEANGWVTYRFEWDGYEYVWYPFDVAEIMMGRFSLPLFLKHGEQRIAVGLSNLTGELVPLREGVIDSIHVFRSRGAELVFPGNIMRGSSYEDVILAYGEPDERWAGADAEDIAYFGDYIEIWFTVDRETGQVRAMSMLVDYAAKLASTTGGLGGDVLSGTFALNGVVYTLPLTLPELEANGWMAYEPAWDMFAWFPINPAAYTLGGRDSRSLYLRYGEQLVVVMLHNPTGETLPLREVVVDGINSGVSEQTLTFPGGILAEDSHYKDVILAHGEPDQWEVWDFFEVLIYFDEYSYVSFGINSMTGQVETMFMRVNR